MSDLERHTVAIPRGLFAAFDKRNKRKGYKNRSEAIRDLIREALVEEQWADPEAPVAATATIVFDHHTPALPAKLTGVQHKFGDMIVSSMHVHLDHHNCLEVLVLRGKAKDIRRLADMLGAIKGVKHAQLALTAEGGTLR